MYRIGVQRLREHCQCLHQQKYRGQGFAGRLIDAAAADFPQKKLLLQVSGSNTAAIRAYTGNGFTFYKTFDYYVAALS